jgi:uncharacterized protein YndB with AHSA1/START domain
MSTTSPSTSAHAAVVVEASIERAFHVFTEEMGTWWDKDHHIIQSPLDHMVFEAREGGAIYDVGTDGSTCRWARVLAFEPPERLVFSWDISTEWTLETDLAKTSEVEVKFIAETPQRTRVELEHRHLERHGSGWEQMRAAVDSPNGWQGGLNAFAATARVA